MAMTMEEFDAILASNSSAAPGGMAPGSISDDKYANLMNSAEQKREDLFPDSRPVNIQSIPDGDGYMPVGGSERRLTGFDAYEVYHPELMNDPKHIERLERQRQRYSREFNKPIEEVSYKDIHREGEKDKLRAAARMFGGEAGQTWEPGPIMYDPEDVNARISLGDAENPINAPLNVLEKQGTGVHGRVLASAFNPETGANVNEAMHTPYNALAFKEQKSRSGKSIPDTQAMQDQNMLQYIENQRSIGVEPTKEELQAFQQANPITSASKSDALSNALLKRLVDGGSAGEDGRALSNIKGAASGASKIISDAGDSIAELLAEGGEAAGLIESDTAEFMSTLFDRSKDDWDKAYGLNKRYSEEATRKLVDHVKNEDYHLAIAQVAKDIDIHLSQSLPEMGALAFKIPGLLAAVNSRVKETSAAFEERTGKEPTAEEKAGMWATSMAVLVPEQLLLVGPLKSIYKSLKKPGTGVKKGFQAAGATVGTKVGNVAKTVGFETAQEIADQAQETAWKEGRIIDSNEAIAAGIAGGVMGGAIRGVAETPGIAAAVKNSVDIHGFKKSLDEMDKYLDQTDKDFAKMSIDADNDSAKAEMGVIKEARTQLSNARKKDNTIEELSKSKNKYVKEYVAGIKSSYIDNNTAKVDHKENKKVGTTILSDSIENEALQKELGFTGEDAALDPVGTVQKINEKLNDNDAKNKIIKALSPDKKAELFDLSVDEKGKMAFENEYGSGVEAQLEAGEAKAQRTIRNQEYVKGKISKRTTSPRISGEVKIDTTKIDSKVTKSNFFSKVFRTGAKKEQIINDLNRYDNQSLRKALDTASESEKKFINTVLDNRTKAKEKAGFGKVDPKDTDYDYVAEDLEISETKDKTMSALKNIMKRNVMRDSDEVANTVALIDKAFDAKHINKTQKKILIDRLTKIDARTKQKEIDEDKVVRASKKRAQEAAKTEEVVVDEAKEEYRFIETDTKKEISGKVVYEERNKGLIHVEAKIDGEVETLVFGYERGNQMLELGKKARYHGGRIHKVADTKEDTVEEDDKINEEDGFATDKNNPEDKEEIDAATKANEIILGEFNVEDLTDDEIKEMSTILSTIFDC